MTARDLLDRIRRRGVHLSVENDRLVYLGVAGALSNELRETIAAHRVDLIDLLQSNLPPRVADWPDARREAYEERAAILEYEAGLPRDEAEQRAREMVLHKHGGRSSPENVL
jgi:hypothetical protein